jgi:hypothetical protein
MSGRWWSQPYRPDGAAAADGINRQLGAPSLDPLVVLLRETGQNSWDARADGRGISMTYAVDRLDDSRSKALRELFLPGPHGDIGKLDDALLSGSAVMMVSDRGTTGLGGPTRSDVFETGEPRDFVNFVRNVGSARDRELGGGTYGFGKGAFFRVSSVGTILVETACRRGDRIERRLMASALGRAFDADGLGYTGRHWWGEIRNDVIEPLLDEAAGAVSSALGLRGFAAGETGTDVYVLGALLGDNDGDERFPRTCEDAATVIASAALWYLWPKLIRRDGRPSIDLSVTSNGVPVNLPEPEAVSQLFPFVQSLRTLDRGGGTVFERKRPAVTIGSVAVEKDIFVNRPDRVVDVVAPFSGPARHCARMRAVELVVDYYEGEQLPDPYQYGAVFRSADVEFVDECFAAAEPPTHDAWVVRTLTGTARGVVEGATRFVRETLRSVAEPAVIPQSHDADVPAGVLSHALAGLLAGAPGDGKLRGGGGRGGGGNGPGSVVSSVGAPRLVVRNGVALVAQDVKIESSARCVAEAQGVVAVDGGLEQSAPPGASVPTVEGWEASDGTWVAGKTLVLEKDAPRKWTVFVRPAGDSATAVRVREARP